MDFNSILNFILPPIIFLGLAYFLFVCFKEPLKGLGGFIKGLFEKFKGEVKPDKITQKYISYE